MLKLCKTNIVCYMIFIKNNARFNLPFIKVIISCGKKVGQEKEMPRVLKC